MDISLILLIIILFILLSEKILEVFNIIKVQGIKKCVYDERNVDYMKVVDEFIRKETSVEILKWVTLNRTIRDPGTYNLTIVSQLTNSDEIKKKVSVITSIIASKISPDLHIAFNRVYKKEIESADKKTFIDSTLHEYIARYVYFMIRRLSYDLTVLINDASNEDKKMDQIVNLYIVSLEETIYSENGIYLIGKNLTETE
jgi:hypothetical protein